MFAMGFDSSTDRERAWGRSLAISSKRTFWPVDGFNIQVKTFFLKTDYSTFARDSGTTPTGAAADGTGVRSFVFPTAL